MGPRRGGFRVAPLSVLIVVMLVLAGCGSSEPNRDPSNPAGVVVVGGDDEDGYHGIKLDQPYVVPPVALTSEQGQVRLAEAEPLTLVFFGYTSCPDICQTVMSTIASALSRLSATDRDQIAVQFVTTDPQRDTLPVMRSYLDRFDPDFEGLTGPMSDIVALGEPLGVMVEQGRKLPSGGYEVDHTTSVTGIKDGRGLVVWTAATSPSDLAADLGTLLKESP